MQPLKVTPEMIERGLAACNNRQFTDDAEMLTEIYRAMASVITDRHRQGILKAKAEGKYKGRPPKIDYAEVRRLYPEIGAVATAKQLGTTNMSVYRILAKAA